MLLDSVFNFFLYCRAAAVIVRIGTLIQRVDERLDAGLKHQREAKRSSTSLNEMQQRIYVADVGDRELAVLWFDLMHDVQLLDRRVPVTEAVGSIAAYYRRVTTGARPMNRLIALVAIWSTAILVYLGSITGVDPASRGRVTIPGETPP